MKTLPNKFFASVISGAIFTMVFTYLDYTPIHLRNSNTYYYSFVSLLFQGLFYMIPLFIVFGMLISLIIDKIILRSNYFRKKNRYVTSLLLYVLMGFIFGVLLTIYYTSLLNGSFLIRAIGYSAFGIMLYYHILIIIDYFLIKVWKKLYEIAER